MYKFSSNSQNNEYPLQINTHKMYKEHHFLFKVRNYTNGLTIDK